MKPIYGMFKRTLNKKNNVKSVPIVYDLEDADGWFSHQERPYVSYKQNENK
jgi:hypothetical protein